MRVSRAVPALLLSVTTVGAVIDHRHMQRWRSAPRGVDLHALHQRGETQQETAMKEPQEQQYQPATSYKEGGAAPKEASPSKMGTPYMQSPPSKEGGPGGPGGKGSPEQKPAPAPAPAPAAAGCPAEGQQQAQSPGMTGGGGPPGEQPMKGDESKKGGGGGNYMYQGMQPASPVAASPEAPKADNTSGCGGAAPPEAPKPGKGQNGAAPPQAPKPGVSGYTPKAAEGQPPLCVCNAEGGTGAPMKGGSPMPPGMYSPAPGGSSPAAAPYSPAPAKSPSKPGAMPAEMSPSQPEMSPSEPAASSSAPMASPPEAAANSTESVSNSTEPMANPPEAAANSTESVSNSTEPMASPPEAAANSTEPGALEQPPPPMATDAPAAAAAQNATPVEGPEGGKAGSGSAPTGAGLSPLVIPSGLSVITVNSSRRGNSSRPLVGESGAPSSAVAGSRIVVVVSAVVGLAGFLTLV